MTGARKRSIFFVGLSIHERDGLDTRLIRSGIFPEHFDVVAHCQEALDVRSCHLLVVNLDGETTEGLHLLGGSEPTVVLIPKLALVDHGDIPTAVKAIKAGAANCLEKPVEHRQLLAEITDLLRQTDRDRNHAGPALTPTETTVLHLLLEGKTNAEVAQMIHRSSRTIEVHRKNIMQKFGVSNTVGLVKAAASMGLLGASQLQVPLSANDGSEQRSRDNCP